MFMIITIGIISMLSYQKNYVDLKNKRGKKKLQHNKKKGKLKLKNDKHKVYSQV